MSLSLAVSPTHAILAHAFCHIATHEGSALPERASVPDRLRRASRAHLRSVTFWPRIELRPSTSRGTELRGGEPPPRRSAWWVRRDGLIRLLGRCWCQGCIGSGADCIVVVFAFGVRHVISRECPHKDCIMHADFHTTVALQSRALCAWFADSP